MKHNSIIIAAIVAMLIAPSTLSAQVTSDANPDVQESTAISTSKVNAFMGLGLGFGVPVLVNADYKVADFIMGFSLGVGPYIDASVVSGALIVFAGPMAALHCSAVNKLDIYAKLALGVDSYKLQTASFGFAGNVGVSYFFTDWLGAGAFLGLSSMGTVAGAGVSMRF